MLAIMQRDVDLVRLAREIAIDHYDIDDLLTRYQLTYEQWGALLDYPRFTQLLANEEESWRSAKNTKERVKLKSAAVIETYLETAAQSLLNGNETLVAKTGLAKLIAGFAGLNAEEGRGAFGHGGAGGFSITINLGDRTLQVGSRQQIAVGEYEEEGEEGEEIEGEVVEIEGEVAEIEGFGAENGEFEGSDQQLDVYAINADLG